jgi:WS/DGAT/MGAT family acyltransferase
MGGLFAAEPTPVPDEADRFAPGERVPSSPELLLGAVGALATLPWRTARTAAATARAAARIRGLSRSGLVDPRALPFRSPRTSFNHPVTANRSVAFVSVPLPAVQEVKRAAGATVNDVVLAVCAGALRRFLDARHELPSSSLVAAVPVSVRRPEQASALGNRVSGWFVSLATDLDDPAERLRRVRDAAAGAKRLYESGAEDVVMDWADLPAPAMWRLGVRLYTSLRMSERMPPVFNLLISNVAGAPFPLYAGPAHLVASYPFGPVLDAIGINITVLSGERTLDFGIVTCPELVADPWLLAAGVPAALDELAATVKATA